MLGRAGVTVGTAAVAGESSLAVPGTSSGEVGGGSVARATEGLTASAVDKEALDTFSVSGDEGRDRDGKRFFTLVARTACTMPSFQTASVGRSRPAAANARNWVVEKGPNHLPSLTTCNPSLMFRVPFRK